MVCEVMDGSNLRSMILASEKTIERLTIYHFILRELHESRVSAIYSKDLAKLAHVKPSQVRRDLMVTGYAGNTRNGYDVVQLQAAIDEFFNFKDGIKTILFGAGTLGRALLTYFYPLKPKYEILAVFDKDKNKIGRVLSGTRIYPVEEFSRVISGKNVKTGILAVPAQEAQITANLMVDQGIRGILNFAPARLLVPPSVFVEDMNLRATLEKVAWFADK